MAQFDADIALRVQVLDSEIKELESRINKINNTKITVNPYLPSGARRADAITRSEADRLKIQQAALQIDKNRLELEQKISAQAAKTLNTRSSWVRALQKGAQWQRDIAKNAEKEATRRGGRRLENLALGAGFPLLFGGGAGAVTGGVLGSFAGDGFGGQILASAIGQLLDDFANRAAELGRALNPLTADVDVIIERVGLVGTKTGTYIEALKKADQSTEALVAATKELEAIIGTQGVAAFRNFGEQTQEFSNQWQIAMTQMGAALASVLDGPLGALLASLERANAVRSAATSADPELRRLATEREAAGRPGILGEGFGGLQKQEEITDRIVERTRELAKEREKELATIKKTKEVDLTRLNLVSAQLDLARTSGDITDDNVYKLKLKVIEQDIYVKLQNAINKGLETESILQEENLKKQQLKNQRQDALIAKYQKLLGLQSQLIGVTLQAASLDVESARITGGRLAAVTEEYNQQDAIYNLKARALQLDLQRTLASRTLSQQERELYTAVYQEQLANLEKQTENKKLQLRFAAAQLKLERELEKIQSKRQTEQLGSDLNRQISDVQDRLASPFATNESELLQLRVKQARRYEDAIRGVNEKIEEQQAIIRSGLDVEGISAERVANLQRQLDLYNQLLPKLNAVEQAELKQQQALRALQPVVSALASGMSDVVTSLIDGTSTVEEAVSRMFANIGKALIDYATQAIAIYSVLAIWRALAGVSSGGSSADAIPSTGNPAAPTINGFDTGMNTKVAAEGAYWSGGFSAFADGGMVTKPTLGLVGEGGEAEYIIPSSKMNGAMARWNAGVRGEDVIDGPGGAPGGGGGGGEVPTFHLETTMINNVEYATVDQVRQMGSVATQRGAVLGETRTLRKLQMSGSTRRKLNI